MSQTAITFAFEQWKAKEAVNGSRVVLDEFVFANVPGLDASKPIDRKEGMPAAGRIVHRQAVNKTGVVNNNAVVYSVTLGTEVGDFDFNWIGLVNKASNTVAMIVHAPAQRKVANHGGQQGNAITRSFVMEYDGAASETAITTPAETWQIDFTARLGGIDEMQRLINLDHYGAGAFFGNGFLVAKTGAQYFVTAGTGYVRGLRAVLAANQNITVTTKPIKVWADVSLQGNVVSQWAAAVKFTVAATAENYTDNAGFKHYVFAVASIDAAGNITDLRPKGSLSDQAGNDAYLRKDDNLASLKDKAKSRANLGLKSAALLDAGEAAGQVLTANKAFGLGLMQPERRHKLADIAGANAFTGFTWSAVGDPDTPPIAASAGVINHAWRPSTTADPYVMQLGWRGGRTAFRTKDSNQDFLGWNEFLHTGNGYTSAQCDSKFALRSIKVNGKPLSADVNLLAGDVNAWNKTEADARYLLLSGGTVKKLTIKTGSTGSENTALLIDGVEHTPFVLKRTSANANLSIGFQLGGGKPLYRLGINDKNNLSWGTEANQAANATIYHTSNKPTAADVGAVALTGSTMTGELGTPRVVFPIDSTAMAATDATRADGFTVQQLTAVNKGYPVPGGLGTLVTAKVNEFRNVQLAFGSGNTAFYLRSLRKDEPASDKWDRVYTQAFKPTAADVGALTDAQALQKYALRSIKVNGKPLSADVNLVAADINAWNKTESDSRYLMKSGGQLTGTVKTSAEIQSTKADNYRQIYGDYGTFWRNDGNSLYLLMTKAKDQYGTFNALRPFSVDVKAGHVSFGHNVAVNGLLRANKNISVGEDLFVDRNATVSGSLTVGKSTHSSDGNILGSRWGNKWLWDAVIEQVNGRVDWNSFNNRTHVAGDRNAWWYKDELTGFIIQGGVVNRVDYVNWVGFPRGYARECFGVQLTLTSSNGTWFGDSRVNIQPRDLSNNGFNAMMDGQEQVVFWQSVGV